MNELRAERGQPPLPSRLGHRPVEVYAGALLGVALGWLASLLTGSG